MNSEIKKGISEYDDENYKKALSHFKKVSPDDEDYHYSLVFRVSCLMKLRCYREALPFINKLIEKEPYEDVWWIEKAWAHVFLKEKNQAYSALSHLERTVDVSDKVKLLQISKLYNLLDDDSKVLEYADKALEVDEDYKDALYEKITVLGRTHDRKEIDKVSKKLFELSDGKLISLMPIFLLRLFSKDYAGAVDLLDKCDDDEIGDEYIDNLKSVVYNHLSDDLNAKILVCEPADLSVDDALALMLEFQKTGKDHGKIHGIDYFIL